MTCSAASHPSWPESARQRQPRRRADQRDDFIGALFEQFCDAIQQVGARVRRRRCLHAGGELPVCGLDRLVDVLLVPAPILGQPTARRFLLRGALEGQSRPHHRKHIPLPPAKPDLPGRWRGHSARGTGRSRTRRESAARECVRNARRRGMVRVPPGTGSGLAQHFDPAPDPGRIRKSGVAGE